MKTNKFLKISLLICAFALILGALFAMSINASDETGETAAPKITAQNVFYTDRFQLMFAVKADPAVTSVTLNVYEDYPENINIDENTVIPSFTQTEATPPAESGLAYNAYIFKLDSISAAELVKEYYVQAVDSNGKKSETKKYSIAEYLYQRLATTGERAPSEAQKAFYLSTIDFGASAQKFFGDKNKVVLSDYSYLYVNGEARGIVPTQRTIRPYVENVYSATWDVTATDANGKTTKLNNQVGGFKIPGKAVKTEAVIDTAGTTVNFKEGTDNLSKTAGVDTPIGTTEYWANSNAVISGSAININDTTRFMTPSVGTNYYSYMRDTERGVVAMFDITQARGNKDMRFAQNSALTDIATATAYELSFDMKIELNGTQTAGQNSRIYVRFNDTSVMTLYYYWTDTGKNKLKVDGGSTYDVAPDEWINIRMVMYKTADKDGYNAFIYINGLATQGHRKKNTSLADISEITYGGIYFYGAGDASIIDKVYIDNIFCGLTTDTLS